MIILQCFTGIWCLFWFILGLKTLGERHFRYDQKKHTYHPFNKRYQYQIWTLDGWRAIVVGICMMIGSGLVFWGTFGNLGYLDKNPSGSIFENDSATVYWFIAFVGGILVLVPFYLLKRVFYSE